MSLNQGQNNISTPNRRGPKIIPGSNHPYWEFRRATDEFQQRYWFKPNGDPRTQKEIAELMRREDREAK